MGNVGKRYDVISCPVYECVFITPNNFRGYFCCYNFFKIFFLCAIIPCMEMRWAFLLNTIASVAVTFNAVAQDFDYVTNGNIGSEWNIETNTIVSDTVSIDVDTVNILNSVILVNNGTISGNFNICDGCDVYIRNSGDIVGDIYVPDTAWLIHVVTSSDDLVPVGINGNYDVLLYNADRLSLSGIQGIATGANKLTIRDSSILIDTVASDVLMPYTELSGNITLYIDDSLSFSHSAVLSNIYDDGTVRINIDKNPLYRVSAYIRDNSLFVDVERETDYDKVFDEELGDFLDTVKDSDEQDDLLQALEKADSASEVNKIISQSGRLHPIRLMDSVRMFNRFELQNNLNVRVLDGVSLRPTFMFSDGVYIGGISVGGVKNISDNFNVGLNLYTAYADFENDFDKYKFALYGGNVHAAYFYDCLIARIIGGVTFASFDDIIVFDGKTNISNPHGITAYGIADIGFELYDKNNFSIAPFVRAGFDYASVLNFDDSDFIAGIGTDIVFNNVGYDIKYDYGLRLFADVNGAVDALIQMNMISVDDYVGGTLAAGIIYDENFGVGCKFELGVSINF